MGTLATFVVITLSHVHTMHHFENTHSCVYGHSMKEVDGLSSLICLRNVFNYIFQGVAIFFFHVVRNDKVWSKLTCSESRKLKKLKREAKVGLVACE